MTVECSACGETGLEVPVDEHITWKDLIGKPPKSFFSNVVRVCRVIDDETAEFNAVIHRDKDFQEGPF